MRDVCSQEALDSALRKIWARWQEFLAATWTPLDLTGCALRPYWHHGLAIYLRPSQDIGRIWPDGCELLGSPTGKGLRSRLLYWRGRPLAEHLARGGVLPPDLAAELARKDIW